MKTEQSEFAKEFESALRSYIVDGGFSATIKEMKYEFFEIMYNNIKKILNYSELLRKQITIYLILEAAYK